LAYPQYPRKVVDKMMDIPVFFREFCDQVFPVCGLDPVGEFFYLEILDLLPDDPADSRSFGII
jgi:hypothetical protein